MRRLLLALGLCLALVTGACGDDDDQQAETAGGSATSSSSSTSTTEPGSSTTAPDDHDHAGDDQPDGSGSSSDGAALVTLDLHGGFVPVEHSVGNTAEVVVLTDGRVLSGAPTPAIYPGPALAPFQVSTADRAAIDALVDAAAALDPDADYGQPGPAVVADAPFTTVTLHRDGKDLAVTAEALGFSNETGPRKALQAVVDRIHGLADGTGQTLYEPTALRVHDITDQAGPRPQPEPGQPSGTVRPWPIPHDGSACRVVSDPAQVRSVLEVVRAATQLDWYRTDKGERRLIVVPFLPGDPGCATS